MANADRASIKLLFELPSCSKGPRGINVTLWRERRMVSCQARGATRTRRYVCDTQRRRWSFAAPPRRAAAILLPGCVAAVELNRLPHTIGVLCTS